MRERAGNGSGSQLAQCTEMVLPLLCPQGEVPVVEVALGCEVEELKGVSRKEEMSGLCKIEVVGEGAEGGVRRGIGEGGGMRGC